MPQQFIFHEVQQFRHWLIWVLFIPIASLLVYGLYKQIYLGESFGDNPMSNLGLVLITLLIIGMFLLFWFMKLETTIDKNGVRFRFLPFLSRTIPLQQIESAEVLQYGFVGGWGIRLGTKYGTVYNISGNKGLAIQLKSGKKFLIGTQKLDELKKIVVELSNFE